MDALLEAIENQPTDVYSLETAASVGQLIGAKYLVIGEVTGELNLRVSLRLVAVDTGEVVSTGGTELGEPQIADLIRLVRPPRYRIGTGAVFETLIPLEFAGVGASVDFLYLVPKLHALRAGVRVYGLLPSAGQLTYRSYYSPGLSLYASLEPDWYASAVISYGLRMRPSRFLALWPEILAGYLFLPFNAMRSYYETPRDYNLTSDEIHHNIFIGAAFRSVLIPDSPVSVYFLVGYKQFLLKFEDDLIFLSANEVYSERPFAITVQAGLFLFF